MKIFIVKTMDKFKLRCWKYYFAKNIKLAAVLMHNHVLLITPINKSVSKTLNIIKTPLKQYTVVTGNLDLKINFDSACCIPLFNLGA